MPPRDRYNRLGPKIVGTDERPIVGREDRAALLKELGGGEHRKIVDGVAVIPDGPDGDGSLPTGYLNREAQRAMAFEKAHDTPYDPRLYETTHGVTAPHAKRMPVIYRTRELPEGETEGHEETDEIRAEIPWAGEFKIEPVTGVRIELTGQDPRVTDDAREDVEILAADGQKMRKEVR